MRHQSTVCVTLAVGVFSLFQLPPTWDGLRVAPAASPTFGGDVRAILAARCDSCHASGGPAPMPLTTYDEVRPWGRAIKEQILSRRMPVWHAARGFGAFTNDPTLTPQETATIVSWVDGGMAVGEGAKGAGEPKSADGAGANGAVPLRGATGAQWISGWTFEPGDALITSVEIRSASGPIGTWVAGDPAVIFPAGAGMRIAGAIQIDVHRRTATSYERPSPLRRPVLRVIPRSAPPAQRVWIEQTACGAQRTTGATLLAVRPLLARGADAHLWLHRAGAPASIVGWFRNFAPAYPRTYWLARPLDLSVDARLESDVPCKIELTLANSWPVP
jgi:hypothetical protein